MCVYRESVCVCVCMCIIYACPIMCMGVHINNNCLYISITLTCIDPCHDEILNEANIINNCPQPTKVGQQIMSRTGARLEELAKPCSPVCFSEDIQDIIVYHQIQCTYTLLLS